MTLQFRIEETRSQESEEQKDERRNTEQLR
jgi:hypothetical protein